MIWAQKVRAGDDMGGSRLWSRVQDKASRIRHRMRLLGSIRHIHGPPRFETATGEVTVVTLIRDGMFYLDEFLDYYRSLGVRHFVFVDNGSTDGTINRIAREPNMIIVQSHLPWGLFENDFRSYAARKYCAQRWCLYADMDEQFDFEASQDIGLTGLVRYLDNAGYTALVAQMLEMFPDSPLRTTADLPFGEVLARYRYYDPGHVSAIDYHDPAIPFSYYLRANTLPDTDTDIRFLFGGVRRKVFGEDCALTKHPLVFVGRSARPGVHPHCASGVSCADFTGLIRHYKFTDNPFGRDARSLGTAGISHGEDRQRLEVARDNPDLTLYSDQSRRFTGIGALQDNGFLVRSARFSAFISGHSDV